MSGRRRQSLSPSLFPFLAVLVCTLGTLILLLALVAQNASSVAAHEAEQKKQEQQQLANQNRPSRAEAQALIDDGAFRVEQLVMVREQQTSDIERLREQSTQVESHIQRIRQELKLLNDEVDLATGEKELVQSTETNLDELRNQVRSRSAEVEKLREEKQFGKPRVAIIPHKGPNGTDRRPVYLECTPDGLTIWPEGSRITASQLQESVDGANPLDAALRVVRHYALQNYGDQIAPYPMLIVRPDGIATYATARRALHEWDDQFGYELVPDEVDLAYDVADPKLKNEVDNAIHAAVIRQHGLNALAKRATQSYSGRVSGDQRRYPSLSASAMDRRGRASGFADHRENFGHRGGYAKQFQASRDYQDQSGAGTGSEFSRDFDRSLRDAATEMKHDTQHDGTVNHGSSTNNPFFAGQPNNPVSGTDVGTGKDPKHGIEGGTANWTPTGTPTGDVAASLDGGQTGDGDQAQRTDDQAQLNQYLSPTIPQQTARETNPFAMPGQPSNQGSAQATGGSQSRPTQGNPSGGSSSQAARPGAVASQAQASAQNAASQRPPNAQQTPNVSFTKDLVKRSGTNWALPRSMALSNGNAIVRTIRVKCYSTHMILMPSRNDATPAVFGVAETDMNRVTLQLATAIRNRIERWGAALPGGRWQPRLEVEVMPGGDQRFEQMRQLMTGSGVEVIGKRSTSGANP